MRISKLEYVKMQVAYVAGLSSRSDCSHSPNDGREMVDRILELNGITVSDEPEVKPMSESEACEWLENCFDYKRDSKKCTGISPLL